MNHRDSKGGHSLPQRLTFRLVRLPCFVAAFALLSSVIFSGLANAQTFVSTPRLTQSEIDAQSWGDDPWSSSEDEEQSEGNGRAISGAVNGECRSDQKS